MGQGRPRRHSHEFRVEIAQRMLNGECVKALSEQYGLPRSMMYRWRDAYRKGGPEGLQRRIGRPSSSASKPTAVGSTVSRPTQAVDCDVWSFCPLDRLISDPLAPRIRIGLRPVVNVAVPLDPTRRFDPCLIGRIPSP